MPGGGTAFGPQPRDYSYALQKKVKKAGLRVALSYLHKEKKLWIVDSIEAKGKTKDLSKMLQGLGVEKAILVDVVGNDGLKRAARNLTNYKFVAAQGINVFDLLKYDGCVLSKAALTQIAERLGENDVK